RRRLFFLSEFFVRIIDFVSVYCRESWNVQNDLGTLINQPAALLSLSAFRTQAGHRRLQAHTSHFQTALKLVRLESRRGLRPRTRGRSSSLRHVQLLC